MSILTLNCTNGDLFLCFSMPDIDTSKISGHLQVNKSKQQAWMSIVDYVRSFLIDPISRNDKTCHYDNDESKYLDKKNGENDQMTFDADWKTECESLINSVISTSHDDIYSVEDVSADLTESERDVISKGDSHVINCMSFESRQEEHNSDEEDVPFVAAAVSDKKTDKKQEYVCQYCERTFPALHRLRVHLHTHTDDKPFKCNGHCEKSFGSKAQLIRHILQYMGVRNYSCMFCGKNFSTKPDLRSHLITHNTIKPFQCSYCGKTFARMSQVNRHNLTHTGERRYQCSICGKSFSTVCSLKQHNYTHTGHRPRPHNCTVCSKSFSKRSHLNRHYKTNSHLHM